VLVLLQSKALSRDVLETVDLQALHLTVSIIQIVISAIERTANDRMCSLSDSALRESSLLEYTQFVVQSLHMRFVLTIASGP